MRLNDLDYFQANSGEIFIVRGSSHPKDSVLACPVYWPDQKGDRISERGERYRKEVVELAGSDHHWQSNGLIPRDIALVGKREIRNIWRPASVINKFKKEFSGTIWHKIFLGLVGCGVPENEIGIFGSYLVGLHRSANQDLAKDIDFLVYGENNCRRLKKGMKALKSSEGLSPISQQHISYESKKLGGQFDASKNTFDKTLANKWSSIQVAEGILTTIRFVRKPQEERPYKLAGNPIVGKKLIRGRVIEDFGTNFVPRTFSVYDGNRIWKVLTYFWVYHQAVQNDQLVEIAGNLHQDGLITIDRYNQGIKIIGGVNDLLPVQPRNLHPLEISRRGAVGITN